MPFGMVNSGATFVRGLKKVLKGLLGVGSYIDDIVSTVTVGKNISGH